MENPEFDTRVDNCEDYDLLINALANGFVPVFRNEGLVYYRQHDQSVRTNQQRQFLVDGIMHHRVYNLLDRYRHFPENHRTEGIFAFIAGIFKTVLNLAGTNPEIASDLLELGLPLLDESLDRASQKKSEWSFPLKLYCFKILCFLNTPQMSGQLHANEYERKLVSIVRTTSGRKSVDKIALNLMLEGIIGRNLYLLQRLFLIYLTPQIPVESLFPLFQDLKRS